MTIIARFDSTDLIDGTTVDDNTAGTGDTPLDVVTSGAWTIDNSGPHPPRLQMDQAASKPAQAIWETSTLGTLSGYAVRAYVELSALPSAGAPLLQAYSSSSLQWRVDCTVAGLLRLRDASNTVVATASTAIDVATKIRLEAKVSGTSAVIIAANGDIPNPLVTLTGTVGSGADEVRFGNPQTAPTWATVKWDNLAVSDEAVFIGPVPLPFPSSPLPIQVELYLGTWTDITQYVIRDPVQITRGRSAEGSTVDPSTLNMTINNRDGRFSGRNPNSPYYGQLGRNTPIRVRLNNEVPYLYLPGFNLNYLSTPDASQLDITGDIDIRMELTPSSWRPVFPVMLASKYVYATDEMSWAMVLRDSGVLTLDWSTDGVDDTLLRADSTDPVPTDQPRLAVRATLDVDNGSSGCTVTFYTADSISGPWTQLGDPVTKSGTTSIFSSTSAVEIGSAAGGEAGFSSSRMYQGRVHNLRVLDGIDGTVACDPGISRQTEGDTSWTGTDGLTWTLHGTARLMRPARIHAEVASWPQRADLSGTDVYVPLEAAGIMRRLGQGAAPVQSTLRRIMTATPDPNLVAYWPCEDAGGAFASAFSDGPPLRISSEGITYQSDSGFVGSAPLPSFGKGRVAGRVDGYTVTGETQVRALLHVGETLPDSARVLIQLATTGTASRWDIWLSLTDPGQIGISAYDRQGTQLLEELTNRPVKDLYQRISLELTQDGADIDWQFTTLVQGSDHGFWHFDTLTGQTVGQVRSVVVGNPFDLGGITIGQVALYNKVTSIFDLTDQFNAYTGDYAGARMRRLSEENGIPFSMVGEERGTAFLGPQQVDTYLNLMQQAADADGGILYESRDELGLAYRTRASMYNQPVTAAIDYTAHELSAVVEETDDDQAVANDLTVTRTGGSSVRVVQEDGTMSVQDPPDGVGRYASETTINIESDDDLADQASWRLHLGTVDEPRIPALGVALESAELVANPDLAEGIERLDLGDQVTLVPPSWLPPPDLVRQIAQGYSETLSQFQHDFSVNTSPGSPWQVAAVGDDDLGRADTDGSELVADATSTGTGLLVASTAGPAWTVDTDDVPMDLRVGGEVVTATDITDAVSDGFDRTSSNGLGSTPEGYAWSVHGTTSDYAVSSGIASLTIGTAGQDRIARLPIVTPAADVEVQWRTHVAPITGSALWFYVLTHMAADFSQWYALRLRLMPDDTIRLGVETGPPDFTLIGDEEIIPRLSVAADVWHRARIRVQQAGDDTVISTKVWPQGWDEPDWQVTVIDDSYNYSTGGVGLRGFVPNTNTNSLPIPMQFGEVLVHNPQAMTVTRSVNDVVKAQTSGTSVELATPPIAAL